MTVVVRTLSYRFGALCIGLVCILGLWDDVGSAAEVKEFRFGVIIPLTGRGASGGERMQQGVELAVEDINRQGGIHGVPLKAIYEDHEIAPRVAVNAMNKLVRIDKVPFVITSFSATTLAIAPIAQEFTVAMINPGAVSPRLQGVSRYLFHSVPLADFQMRVMLQHAVKELGLKRYALIYRNDDMGNGMLDFAKGYLPRIGAELVAAEAYEPNAVDFRTHLAKVRQAEPEAIYVGSFRVEQATILKQAGEMRIKTQWLGYSGFENQDTLDLAPTVAEGARYTMAEARGPQTDAFFKAYEAKYGKGDVEYSVYAWYDATQIFAAALRYALDKGWKYTGEAIIRAIREMPPYEGVFGRTTFAEDGTVRKPITIKTVKNGWWAELKTYSLEEIERLF